MNYIKATNYNDEPVWAVEANGFAVYDPYTSECGRFAVTPDHYGLTETQAQELINKNEADGFTWKC